MRVRLSMRIISLTAQTRLAAPLAFGLVTAASYTARAAEPTAFILPGGDEDGYGIGECLRSGSPCGRVIADAWCEAHGHARALAFGSAADATGTTLDAIPVNGAAATDGVLIRCGE